MEKLIIYYHPECLLHRSSEFHVERPERAETVLSTIIRNFRENWELKECEIAKEEYIRLVHTNEHWNFVRTSVENKRKLLDGGDTYACDDSLRAALRAAGSVVDAVNEASEKNVRRFFCCIRPPGHHAESDKVMGFCLFNNVAIGAAYATRIKGYKKVAIVDWDVHHGNGTQEIFYSDPDVLFISVHQHPLYPGTGMKYEKGAGRGNGFTYNFPVNPGTDGEVYQKIFTEEIVPLLKEFRPEICFISAGFDAHKDDTLADIRLTEEDFYQLTGVITHLSNELGFPIISVLEGGYNLKALSQSVLSHISALSE